MAVTNRATSTRKTLTGPPMPISVPAMSGAQAAAMLSAPAITLSAGGRCSRSTTSGVELAAAGMLNAEPTPSRNTSSSTDVGVISPKDVTNASTRATTTISSRGNTSSSRLSTTSASAPATRISRNIGAAAAV
jgi:hypothetical protein